MEQAQKITDIVDAYKKKLTDKQYKDTLEALGELLKVKIPEKEIYVKVRRIRVVSTIYRETEETVEDGTLSHTEVSTLGPTNEWRHSSCDTQCDCGDCCSIKLKTVEFKSELNETVEYFKVLTDDDDMPQTRSTIPTFMYEVLKKNKTVHHGPEILVYLEDNE
tara:strand:- start:23 stop:511 length:489 start_codon:yes stop_codon:yes gene_type:complete